jgi:hypothetical protein
VRGLGINLPRDAQQGLTFQNYRLFNHAREVRDRLFVDGRRLRLSRLPDFRQVAAGQDCQKADALFRPLPVQPIARDGYFAVQQSRLG